MGGAARRRLMGVLVLAASVWPLAHAALVARFHVDPWEFFGWSMYTQPAARVQVGVEIERGGAVEPLRVMGDRRRAIRRHAQHVTAFGALASDEPLARLVLSWDSEVDATTIIRREVVLDPDSTYLVARESRERFERGAIGP